MKIPPRIVDEYTHLDLPVWKKYKLRHPKAKRDSFSKWSRKAWANKSAEERTATHLWKRYKMSFEEWVAMFEKQDYKCCLCETPVRATTDRSTDRGVVDHCHTDKSVRGILCHNCNRALGLVKDKTQTLKNMINYLGGQH